jgi:hypothetical protein
MTITPKWMFLAVGIVAAISIALRLRRFQTDARKDAGADGAALPSVATLAIRPLTVLTILMLFTSAPAVAQETNYSEICSELRKYEENSSKDLPKQIDEVTELLKVNADCTGRRLSYTKRLLVSTAAMPEGWVERMQRQHVQLHCNIESLATKSGWTVLDNLFGSNYDFVRSFKTAPSDCD